MRHMVHLIQAGNDSDSYLAVAVGPHEVVTDHSICLVFLRPL